MTKKQKEEYERQKQSELRKAGKIPTEKVPNSNKIPLKKPLHALTKTSESKTSSQYVSDNKSIRSSHNQNGSASKSHASNSFNGITNKANFKEHSSSQISTESVSR